MTVQLDETSRDSVEENLSPEARWFADLLASGSEEPSQIDVMRALSERVHQAATEPEGVTYRDVVAGGVPGIWVQPPVSDDSFVLLHSHAGGSVVTSAAVDRKLAGHIATAVGVPALVLDFRRAPEAPYPAQVDDVDAAFDWLVHQGYDPSRIIPIGHSIGGYLAIAVALRRRDAGKPLPGAVVSISPWADPTMSDPAIEANASTDKVLSRQLLELFRGAWLGGTGIDPADPQVNLNQADLSSLPPTLVSWGTYEVLAGEDRILADRLREAGVPTTMLPVPGGQHSYVWSAGRVPETDRAIASIADWIRASLPVSTS